MRLRIVAIGMLFLLCTVAVMVAQNGNDLFQQGLAKERADGDLQGAIKIYDRIVREFPSNRPIVAKALVQLGICYEKLGQDKAREYFQQVIAKYSDQTDMVVQAKTRLNVTSGTSLEIATPFTRDIYSFAISPDGRSLVFVATVDGKTSLWLRHLDSGKQAPATGHREHALCGRC
jgi:tetratricopeptide (TPR) repeat protein